MWMSLMTSGVKILECPRTFRPEGAVSSAMPVLSSALQDELALGGLEIVVVVELLAAHELLELRRRPEAVDGELPLDELGVGVRPLPRDAVDAKRLDLAADVDRAVVHGVAEAGADVAEEDLPAALHHEARHRAGRAEHDDRAALLVDPGAGADAALDDEVAAAKRRSGERARVRLDDDDAGHHVLAGRPADAPVDLDLRAVDEATAEVAEAAVEGNAA